MVLFTATFYKKRLHAEIGNGAFSHHHFLFTKRKYFVSSRGKSALYESTRAAVIDKPAFQLEANDGAVQTFGSQDA
ncbi:hypothetical protein [Brevibacillus porteri]|nr:hypothetical protein [Brevibacillus porteri]MED2812484.1 hypothetical protein [Brevibacillus porteri]